MIRRGSGLILALLLATPLAPAAEQETVIRLPESLAQWYKPQNKRQVWLHGMFAMRRALQAIDEYAADGDLPRLRDWSRKLDSEYRALEERVPEWKDYLDYPRLDALNRAVASGDARSVAEAARRFAERCQSCHEDNQALAALKYRTPDFSRIELIEGQAESRYPAFMKTLSHTVNRIRIAAEDGLWTRAGEAGYRLEDQLGLLSHSCIRCHQERDPYERIFGGKTRKAFTDLQRAIAREDLRSLRMSLGEAAVLACARCHSVHKLNVDLKKRLFH